eukprot:gene5679-8943_t
MDIPSGSHEYNSPKAGEASPLAQRLFSIDGVSSLFFGPNFITVTKTDEPEFTWEAPLPRRRPTPHPLPEFLTLPPGHLHIQPLLKAGFQLFKISHFSSFAEGGMYRCNQMLTNESGDPVFLASAGGLEAEAEEDDEIVAMIKELLETRIRPSVNEDGGDITFRHFDPDTGIVTVKMM